MMKKFISLALIASLFAPFNGTYAALKQSDIQKLDKVSKLSNGGFENGLAKWVNTGAGTFTKESASPIEGGASAKWNPSATSETLDSELYAIEEGLKNTNCQLEIEYSWASGVDGEIKLVVHDGTSTLHEVDLEQSSVPRLASINFPCPGSGSLKARLESTADAAEITLDNVYLGRARNIYDVSDFFSDWIDYSNPNDAWKASITNPVIGDGTINAQYYEHGDSVTALININVGSTTTVGSGSFVFKLPSQYTIDASKLPSSGVLYVVGGVRLTDSVVTNRTSGLVYYYAPGNGVIAQTEGSGDVTDTNPAWGWSAGDAISVWFTVPVVGKSVGAKQALRADVTGWIVNASITGTGDIGLGTAAKTKWTAISDPNLVLTNKATHFNSIPADIACDTTEVASGTTCTGNETLGVSFINPYESDVEVCTSFVSSYGSTASHGPGFAVALYPNNDASSGATIEELGPRTFTQAANAPQSFCGTLHLTEGRKTIRLGYAQPTQTGQTFIKTNPAFQSDPNINFTIRPLNGGVTHPVLLNSVTSSENVGIKTEWAKISSAGSISALSGDWLDSSSKAGTGDYDLTIKTGQFTSTPGCTGVDGDLSGNPHNIQLSVASTTAIDVITRNSTSGTNEDSDFFIECKGK